MCMRWSRTSQNPNLQVEEKASESTNTIVRTTLLSPAVFCWRRLAGLPREYNRVHVSLYHSLAADPESKATLFGTLPARHERLATSIQHACANHEQYALPEPFPSPLSLDTFFNSHGTFSTSDRQV